MLLIFKADGTLRYSIGGPPVTDLAEDEILVEYFDEIDFMTQWPRFVNGEVILEDQEQSPPPQLES